MKSDLTRRQRLHLTTRAEIMETARQQIAVDSNSGVSLHAIARQMGMTAPALYRYFKSRDDLVAALIESAHSALGLALSTAVATCSTCDYAGQALALPVRTEPGRWHGFLFFAVLKAQRPGACVPFAGVGLPLAQTVNGEALTSAAAIEAAADAGLVMLVDTEATFLGVINPGK